LGSGPAIDPGITERVNKHLSSTHPHLSDTDYTQVAVSEISQPLQHLGQGAFGDVQLCQYKPAQKRRGWRGAAQQHTVPRQVAVKTIKADGILPISTNIVVQFLIEARVLLALEHKHIVYAIGVQEAMYPPQLVLEYCPGGDLLQFLRSTDTAVFECDIQLAYTDMLMQIASAITVSLCGCCGCCDNQLTSCDSISIPSSSSIETLQLESECRT
jgi:serine/threonine protein kinase